MDTRYKFTVLDYIIGLFLIGTIYFTIGTLSYFTIGTLSNDRLNLNPLFALVCFVLAFGIFSLKVIVSFFFKDPKKNKIAKAVLLVITFIILIFLGIFWLEINGYYQ